MSWRPVFHNTSVERFKLEAQRFFPWLEAEGAKFLSLKSPSELVRYKLRGREKRIGHKHGILVFFDTAECDWHDYLKQRKPT